MSDMTIKDRLQGLEPRQILLPLLLVLLFIGIAFGIVNYQKQQAAKKAPKLTVAKPAEGETDDAVQIVLQGTTDTTAKVTVNGRNANVDKKGNFASEVPLSEGENIITVKSTATNGKTATIERHVVRPTAHAQVTQTPAPTPSANSQNTTSNQNLASAGPEDFWLLETGLLSAAGAAWFGTKRKLQKAIAKR